MEQERIQMVMLTEIHFGIVYDDLNTTLNIFGELKADFLKCNFRNPEPTTIIQQIRKRKHGTYLN